MPKSSRSSSSSRSRNHTSTTTNTSNSSTTSTSNNNNNSPPKSSSSSKTRRRHRARRIPTYKWLDTGVTQPNGRTVHTTLQVNVAGNKTLISVGDSVLLCSGESEEDSIFFPAHLQKKNEDDKGSGEDNNNSSDEDIEESNEFGNSNSAEEEEFYSAENTDENFYGVNALDPFVARVEKMWEEEDNTPPPSSTNDDDDQSDGDKSSEEEAQVCGSDGRLRMKIRARWYFKREDIEGINGQFTNISKKGLLNAMGGSDLVLGQHSDDNEVPTILGKCKVVRRRPANSNSNSSKEKVEDGAYVCRYDISIPGKGEPGFGSVVVEGFKGEDEGGLKKGKKRRLMKMNELDLKKNKKEKKKDRGISIEEDMDKPSKDKLEEEDLVKEEVEKKKETSTPGKLRSSSVASVVDNAAAVAVLEEPIKKKKKQEIEAALEEPIKKKKKHEEKPPPPEPQTDPETKMQTDETPKDTIPPPKSVPTVPEEAPPKDKISPQMLLYEEPKNSSRDNDDASKTTPASSSSTTSSSSRAATPLPPLDEQPSLDTNTNNNNNNNNSIENNGNNNKIKISPNSQAVIPPLSSLKQPPNQNNKSKTPCHSRSVWQPNKLSNEDVRAYLTRANQILKSHVISKYPDYEFGPVTRNVNNGITTNSSKHDYNSPNSTTETTMEISKPLCRECNEDELLSILHTNNYNVDVTLSSIQTNPNQYLTLWDATSQTQFDEGFKRYCGSLRMISKGVVKKTTRDVVDFHYRFKIPVQHCKYLEEARERARRMMVAADMKLMEGNGGGNGGTGGNKGFGGNKKVRNWTASGFAEQRRNLAKEFLFQARDDIGRERYLELAHCLKKYHANIYSIPTLKDNIARILVDKPKLLEGFLDFLPKKYRK